MVLARGWEQGKNKNCCSKGVVSVLPDEKVLAINCTTIWIQLTLLQFTPKKFKMVNFMLCVFYHDRKSIEFEGSNWKYFA